MPTPVSTVLCACRGGTKAVQGMGRGGAGAVQGMYRAAGIVQWLSHGCVRRGARARHCAGTVQRRPSPHSLRQVHVPMLTGSTAPVNIPPGTNTGETTCLKGMGLRLPGQKRRVGDMQVTWHVQIPTKLTSRQRAALHEFALDDKVDNAPKTHRPQRPKRPKKRKPHERVRRWGQT